MMFYVTVEFIKQHNIISMCGAENVFVKLLTANKPKKAVMMSIQTPHY